MEKIPRGLPPPEFRHSELRSNTSIRLIQIHAELFRGDISCALQQYESDNQTCPDYTALSYVWGDPTPTHSIYINGLMFRVHQSLWTFLSHIQSKADTHHTWFWTDLLCIDQAHHSEKNEQIVRMGEIYAQATCVVSWLGNRDETVEALRFFIDISEGIDRGIEPDYSAYQINGACHRLVRDEPYWHRVWLLQEVACARNCIVVCGNISVKLEGLLHNIHITMNRSPFFRSEEIREKIGLLQEIADLRNSIHQGKTMTILELLEKTSFSTATRKQDTIYGLLGLASRLDPGFDPNALEVSRHKTLDDVWWDIIFMVIEKWPDISSIKSNMCALKEHIYQMPPPRKEWELEIRSNIRRANAETAYQVSEAAYSGPVQALIGILRPDRRFRDQADLQEAWAIATDHVYENERHVPGLQKMLGWSTYAGLRFRSCFFVEHGTSKTIVKSLPPGWLCAAHFPDALSKITAKHLIVSHNFPAISLNDPSHPTSCSGGEHDEARCDMSLVVLKIEQLGITCLTRSAVLGREVKFLLRLLLFEHRLVKIMMFVFIFGV